MNCQNCGAAMELFARRRYYFCRHCGTFHFLDTQAMDGLEILARPQDAPECSICKGRLAKSLVDQTHTVEYCEGCRGVLMARRTFADVIVRRRAWASSTSVQPLPIDQTELARRIPCPICGAAMDVHPYYGPGNVVMDSCAACDLVWLDFGELQQIVDAPGSDRGKRDAPPPRMVARSVDTSGEDAIAGHGTGRVDILDLLNDLLS